MSLGVTLKSGAGLFARVALVVLVAQVGLPGAAPVDQVVAAGTPVTVYKTPT